VRLDLAQERPVAPPEEQCGRGISVLVLARVAALAHAEGQLSLAREVTAARGFAIISHGYVPRCEASLRNGSPCGRSMAAESESFCVRHAAVELRLGASSGPLEA